MNQEDLQSIYLKKIEEALQSGMIEISDDERYLQIFEGTTDIII